MLTNHVALLLTLAGLAVPSAMAAQDQQLYTVVISVHDPSGAPIPNVDVRVIPGPEPVPAVMRTDSRGKLSLHLQAGDMVFLFPVRDSSPRLSILRSKAAESLSLSTRSCAPHSGEAQASLTMRRTLISFLRRSPITCHGRSHVRIWRQCRAVAL